MSHHFFAVSSDHLEERLDIFLTQVMDGNPSRSFIQKIIEQGYVKVDGRQVPAKHRLKTAEGVTVDVPVDFGAPTYASAEAIALDIFFQDEHLLVINKPCGMMTHPASGHYSGTLVNALLNLKIELSTFGDDLRPGIVHRLDQDTSGLILVAKNNIAHTRLAKLFQRRDIKKQYLALVEGQVEFDEGVVDQPIGRNRSCREKMAVTYADGSRDALTRYRVMRRLPHASLVALYPATGRTHQLRVHMKYLGHPILGDPKYGYSRTFSRLALHAQSIGFQHPFSKRFIEFFSCTPQEFLDYLKNNLSSQSKI